MPVNKTIGRLNKVNIDDVVSMYVRQHLTLREIGAIVGMTAAGVLVALRRVGVTRYMGEWVQVKCSHCGGAVSKSRSAWKKSIDHYCNQECYMASIHNDAYNQSRAGQLRARKAVSSVFSLLVGHVVHHHDSNNLNNELGNLAVFASQADHMSFHRGGEGRPIWDGRQA